MATQLRSFGAAANDATVGIVGWSSVSNALTGDDTRATVTLSVGGSISQYLKVTNSSYASGTIMTAADTPTMIRYLCEVRKSGNPAANVRSKYLYPVEGGVIQTGTNYALNDTGDWGAADGLRTMDDHVANVPSATTILSSNWGFVLACYNENGVGNGVGEVDVLYAEITFTPAAAPLSVGTFIRQSVNRAANYCFCQGQLWLPQPSWRLAL